MSCTAGLKVLAVFALAVTKCHSLSCACCCGQTVRRLAVCISILALLQSRTAVELVVAVRRNAQQTICNNSLKSRRSMLDSTVLLIDTIY
jgi:hypothetical protein